MKMSLVREEKIAIMREKHTALMKPIVFALEHVRSITAAPAETPHEKWFQDNYGDAIDNALEKLKTPSNPAKPGSSWIPFKEVHSSCKSAVSVESPP
jgi:PI-3-kinase-related kinase SMG-1